jgi:hypothetical protein
VVKTRILRSPAVGSGAALYSDCTRRPVYFAALSKSCWRERHRVVKGVDRAPNPKEMMTMQYLLMIYGDEAAMQGRGKDEIDQLVGAFMAYTDAMQSAGVLVASNRLRPTSTATTVRVADGKTQVLNGPYAETREQLGGYYLIEAPDLDAALSWASRCPGATYGTVEVRPVWVM